MKAQMEETKLSNGKSLLPKKNQEQQVYIDDLLKKSKQSFQSKDFEKAEQLLNGVLLYAQTNLNQKLKAMTYWFYFCKQTKRESELSKASRYYIKHLTNSLQDIDQSNIQPMLKQLFQFAELLHHGKDYYRAYYIYHFLKSSNLNAFKNDKYSIELYANINETFKELTVKVAEAKERFLKGKQLSDLKVLQGLFFDSKYKFPSERKPSCFIVSTYWIKTLIYFLSVVQKNSKAAIDKAFLSKKTAMIYYSNVITDEHQKCFPCYPGPINNHFIIDENDAWFDPKEEEQHTNVYLANNCRENDDFKYIDKDTYALLKKVFDVNFEIERKLINKDYYEVFLLKFKIVVFCPLLFDFQKTSLIRMRKIQTSKHATIKELKAKINRCLGWEVYHSNEKPLLTKPTFKIIIPELPHNPKAEVKMIIDSYCSRLLGNKPKLKGTEIKKSTETLENLKLAEKDILLVEVKNEEGEGNWFLNLTNLEESIKCSSCSKVVSGKKFPCDNCPLYNYCSNDCKEKDTKHKTHHKILEALYKKKFALHDMLCIDINTVVNYNARHGLTGLKNLGNTCFMNSAVQCLSNCEELTKYFILNKYKEELNQSNKNGSRGAIAKAYHELINQLWNGNSPYLSPWDFRQIFVDFAKQFAGFSQHDSHEMLAFMLDALHEDLNRVKTKPYFELKEKEDDETEVEASLRWWKSHVERENSIIVDLFHGQFKNQVKCPQCNRVNINYDPFMHLGLPIPVPQSKIKVKLILDTREIDSKVFYYNCNEGTTVREIKTKLFHEIESTGGFLNKKSSSCIEGIIVDSNKKFKRLLMPEDPIMTFYLNGFEAIFYLYSDYDDKGFNFYVTPVIINSEKGNNKGGNAPDVKVLFYPKLFNVNLEMTVRELYFHLFAYYRKLIKDLPNASFQNFILNKDNFSYQNEEFVEYFEVKDSIPFKLHIINNVPQKAPFSCEYCNRSCAFCQFKFNGTQTVKAIQGTQKIVRPFLLYLEVLLYNKEQFTDNNDENRTDLITKNKDITIHDCLEAFRTEEKLEKDNSWFCSTCQSRQEAFKKLEIFRAPNILIIQLKRFKIKSANLYSGAIQNKKNNSLVVFPLNDLDLRQYIVEENSKKEGIYDLFAISQHFGNLSSGHYTALCKNNGEWYDFDDERVNKSDIINVMSKSAYLLFYRRKNLNQI